MTRAEYEEIMERVMRDAWRIGADGREVVLVMSPRVYRGIRSFEQTELRI